MQRHIWRDIHMVVLAGWVLHERFVLDEWAIPASVMLYVE